MIWKSIPFHTGYEVSEDGTVRRAKTGRVRAVGTTRTGYTSVILYWPGEYRHMLVHQLVAAAFTEKVDCRRGASNR